MKVISFTTTHRTITHSSNWTTAKDMFPDIDICQESGMVTITYYDFEWNDKYGGGKTHEHTEVLSNDGQALLITGLCGFANRRRHVGGRQHFCFAVFVGDSEHIYVHRAPATKGWMECNPANITKRLRKLGIGADYNVIQQGDFLLKPANGNAYPDEAFMHETMGAGHHNFEMPVFYATVDCGRQYKITEPTTLIHHATDGIQHPTIVVPTGIYIVGTTATSLRHTNYQD